MPPRNPELPEGTDHIINGAMETGAGTGASTGSSGAASPAAGPGDVGGDGSGLIGSGSGSAGGDDTGGTAMASTSGGGSATGGSGGGGNSGGGGAPVKQQLRDGVDNLRQQATERVRGVAEDGKSRATSALDDLSRMVNEAADSIDERLGDQYGDYARRAAEAVTGLADTIRDKDVDELWDDARGVVRKSPGVALGVAAVVGFTLARLVKAGLDNDREVQFEAAGGRNIAFEPDAGGNGASSSKGA